jgi:putative addiction module CopG family antidote
MPTRNVSLIEELDSYVEQSVRSGHYDNASEVIRAAIREQSEEDDKAKVEALRVAIAEGLQGPFLDGPTVIAELRGRVRLRTDANRKMASIA